MNKLTIIAIVAGCYALTAHALAQQTNHHAIQWETNPYAASQKAKAESKAVMLHFTADWCGPCQNLKRFVFSNPTVIRAINQNFVPVLVDIDKHKALAQELKVRTVPHDVFLTPDGEVITRRSSPVDGNNYLGMCNSVNYRPDQSLAQTENNIAEFKRETSPMDVPVGDRSSFRAAGTGSVSHVGVSNEAKELAKRSNFGQMIETFGRGTDQNQPEESDPRADLQNAIAGLASKVSASNPVGQKSRFFKIPEKRLDNPAVAYDPATNEFHPHRANENYGRHAFLAKQRPEINVPRHAPAAEPIRVTKNEFFGNMSQTAQSPMMAPSPISGVQVSEMFNPITGRAINPDVSGASVARIKKQTQPQVTAPANEVKIIADSNARIRSYKDIETEFAQQASMVKDNSALDATHSGGPMIKATPEEDFALHGKCPVSLIQQGQWVEGDARWGIVHRDRTYLFSSKENYDLFKTDPDRFSPILSGFDPVVFHEQGKLLDGLEENGVFMGKNDKQHIVLFQSPETRAKFQANPQLYLDTVRQAVFSTSRQAGAM